MKYICNLYYNENEAIFLHEKPRIKKQNKSEKS